MGRLTRREMQIGKLMRDSGLIDTLAGMAKRGYSREFTPQTERRIKREIDRVPPTLDAKVQAKLKRAHISLRWLTLTLWRKWVDGEIALPGEEQPSRD